MEITARSLLTMLHGMGFGALFLLAFSGAFVELLRPRMEALHHQANAQSVSTCSS